MTREQKIVAIYKEMANKELTFGCTAKLTTKKGTQHDVILIGDISNGEKYFVVKDSLDKDVDWFYTNDWYYEFIWHPVMIGDVIDYIEPYWNGYAQDVKFSQERKRKIDIVLLQWDKKREPIEAQSDECVEYVYNLIKK